MANWQIWIVLAALLLVAEMLAPGFWLACVAIGCLAAGLGGLLPIGLVGQVAVFAVATVGSLLGLRPVLVRRFLHARATELRTNVDALIGKTGYVSLRIAAGSRQGRVIVEGEDWRGVSVDDATLEPGTKVTILQVDGTTLVVEREEHG